MNKTTLTPEFDSMLNSAKSYFNQAETKKFEYHQCLILRTANGVEKIYSFACDSVKELINQSCSMLHKEKIAIVTNIVCMWEGESVDVPSHQFVKALCDINSENKKAEILLKSSPTSCVYITKKLSDIIG